jgi:ATP-dependent helicase HrpB
VSSLCVGCRSYSETRRADLLGMLSGLLTHQQRSALEREAPAAYRLPSGRTTPVIYQAGKPPAVAARIQELFGLTATPRLGGGRVPLVIELLAPNHRPVQITDDLESFWRTTYPEVRKQLRGRYPKHAWPEDPFTATPTTSTRRRG